MSVNDLDADDEVQFETTCSGACADGSPCQRPVVGSTNTGNIEDDYCHDHDWQMEIWGENPMAHQLPMSESIRVHVEQVENTSSEFGEQQRIETQYGTMTAKPDEFDVGVYDVTVKRRQSNKNKLRLVKDRIDE